MEVAKLLKKIWFLFLTAFSLSACTATPPRTFEPISLVKEVYIRYQYGDMDWKRHFTDSKKVDTVLYYLYTLSPYGTPPEDPEQIWGDCCEFYLIRTDGSYSIYRQQGSRYLSVNNRPWQKISAVKAARLPALLSKMESDP